MDKFLIELQAKLDETKSKRNINAAIRKLQKQINKLKLYDEVDPKTLSELVKQLDSVIAKTKTDDSVSCLLDTKDLDRQGRIYIQKISGIIEKARSELEDILRNAGSSDMETKSEEAAKESTKSLSDVINAFTDPDWEQAVDTIRELDTALADLKKDSRMSASGLDQVYHSANDTAKQAGATTQEIIEQASAWSSLGFDTAESASKMARLSSQLKLISPEMTSDAAVSGLAGTMKAYGIAADDVLDGILSKVNIIGKNFSLSNADIIAMLQVSASAMAESNNTLEETIALETAAFEITKDQNAGNGFQAAAMRLRGLNEETQEADMSLKNLKSDLYNLTGVAVMKNADTYKSTYQILKELSEVWDSLTAKAQNRTLELIFGKANTETGASVLENFSIVEKAMDTMAHSAGNAEAEISAAADSIDFKLNAVSETYTGILQNLFELEEIKSVLDIVNSLGNALDWLTSKLSLFGTIGAGAGITAFVRNFA